MSESTIALVPVRSLRGSKTRLVTLSVDEREALTRRMLIGVVAAARASAAVGMVAVVSPDPAALALSLRQGPEVVALTQAVERPGLNRAIETGRGWAERQGGTELLVLFGDLPLLTAADVDELVRLDASVILAPDRHWRGTNALRLPLAPAGSQGIEPFTFQFGEDSYRRHRAEAERCGFSVAVYDAPGTAFDLDTPADWRELAATTVWQPERQLCRT